MSAIEIRAGQRWRHVDNLRRLGPGCTDAGPSSSAGMEFSIEGEHERIKGLYWKQMADGRRQLCTAGNINETAVYLGGDP